MQARSAASCAADGASSFFTDRDDLQRAVRKRTLAAPWPRRSARHSRLITAMTSIGSYQRSINRSASRRKPAGSRYPGFPNLLHVRQKPERRLQRCRLPAAGESSRLTRHAAVRRRDFAQINSGGCLSRRIARPDGRSGDRVKCSRQTRSNGGKVAHSLSNPGRLQLSKAAGLKSGQDLSPDSCCPLAWRLRAAGGRHLAP